MLFVRPVAFLSLVSCALSKPLGVPAVVPRQNGPLSANQTICGDIIVHAHNGFSVFYADAVFECLQSVPFNKDVATRFIKYYNMTLQFQSTLAFLKDPPTGYQQPAVDVQKVLSQIQGNVTTGNYKNQYSFEVDVQLLVNRMHDSHVTLNAGILNAFSFTSPWALVSVSEDGRKVPDIYLAEDLLQSQLEGWRASPVTQINGQEVVQWLTRWAELNVNGYLEPNADWNALMDHPAQWISGDLSSFQSTKIYPGDELNFKFANGTLEETYWLAIYTEIEDTGPLTTAGDFYNYFVLGLLPASYDPDHQWWPTEPADDIPSDNSTSNSTAPSPIEVICSRGFPARQNWCNDSYGAFPNDPVVAQTDLEITGGGVVTGYFLNDSSTGVLSIPSFYQYGLNTEEFDYAIQYFIGNATKKNISRVIIDLQTNSGGSVYLAYDTFKQFFYSIDPYAASRIRSHKLADVLGGAYSKWWKDLENDPEGEEGLNDFFYSYYAAEEWVAVNRINAATERNFSSWSEYSPRVSDHGDTFSYAQRYNLSDEVFDANAFNGWIPYGYGIAKAESTPAPLWDPKDVVILTDGKCGSSCALFVELMSHQAGVRTVVVGGRPTTGPMQASSGSRGARVYDASEIDEDFTFVSETINNTIAATLLPNRSDTGMWVNAANINIRDQIRKDDLIPLQFKYEAADCRLYYTTANIFNMSRLWHDVAAAVWDNPSLCVAGSTGYPSARNTTSALQPPRLTAQMPLLVIDPPNSVATPGNSTDGLLATAKKHTSDIKSCFSNSDCDVGICMKTNIRCSSSFKNITACLPACNNHGSGCPAKSVCDLAKDPATSKTNKKQGSTENEEDVTVTKTKKPKNGAQLNVPLRQGHCQPTERTPKLKCPK